MRRYGRVTLPKCGEAPQPIYFCAVPSPTGLACRVSLRSRTPNRGCCFLLIINCLTVPHLVPLLIRGINNLSDARYCAGMGADKLTFVLDPALPGFLDTKTVKELAGWVAGVELIGEFSQLSANEINAISTDCGLDAVLLHGPHTAPEIAELAPPAYLALTPQAALGPTGFASSAAGIIVELTEIITPELIVSLRELALRQPLWLGPGLYPTQAKALAKQLPLAGLFFPSGDEVKPGLRDFDQLEAVFEALEVD